MPLKVLQICAIDSTAWGLLRPQMEAMVGTGWEVHVACSSGPNFPRLKALGIKPHEVPVARNTNLFSHFSSIQRLSALMARERYDVVHVHTPIAAALGRVAARLARAPVVVYTAHGFYFHDEMPPAQYRKHVGLEWTLGRLTDHLMTQSAEDAETAVREGIMPAERVTVIGNGVSLATFRERPAAAVAAWRERLGLTPDTVVIGIVGRLVLEKGFREYFHAARELASRQPHVHFLVIGATARGDRDGLGAEVAQLVAEAPLAGRVHWTGHTEEIPALMHLMDIFTLPSYREGMPRSIIEAMAAGKPVVATNIRGSREEVVEGETGFLVPTRDAKALAARWETLAQDAELRRRMGAAGRARAEALFDESLVCERVIATIQAAVARRTGRGV